MLLEEQLTFVQKHRGIEGRFSVFASGGQSHSGENGGGQLMGGCGEFVDSRTAAGQKARFLQKVGWRVAADGEFGKNAEARAPLRCTAAGGHDSLEISREITDCGVDLGQSDFHTSSLNREKLLAAPPRADGRERR